MPSKNYPKGILRVWLSMAIVLSVFLSGHFYQFVFEWEAHIESNDQPTTIATTVPKMSSVTQQPMDNLPATKIAASDQEHIRIHEGQKSMTPDGAIPSESTTTATRYRNSSVEPPCNMSGTHYFFGETYVPHPNSESFRQAMQEGVYYHDYPSDTGILYAVSGTHEYIESAFVPVIQHLQETLKIPSASERQLQIQQQQSQQQQQWSLAMDPYTCNFLFAQHASTLSFFDVLVIVTKQDLLRHYHQANNNDNPAKSHIPTRKRRKATSYNYSQIIFDHDEYDQQEAEKLATWSTQELEQRRKKRTKSTVGGKNVLGVVSWGDRANFKLRHYVKAIKLHALVEAAFPMTIFIDVDMVPCYKDFGSRLLEDVVAMAAANNTSQNTFDIAVTDVNPTYGLKHPNHNDPTHYLLSRRFNVSEENNGNDSNIHNSMCMALNITSPKTQEFLRKATEHFFSLTNQKTQSKIKVQTVRDTDGVTDAPSPLVTIDLKTRDQPSLGEAMYETWKHYYQPPSNVTSNYDESSITANDDGFKHVDMDIEKVCRNVQIYTTRLKQACPNLDADGNALEREKDNPCLLVHKTTGEGPDSRAINRRRRRENAKKKKKAAAAAKQEGA